MQLLKNMKIRTKLYILVTIASLLVVGIGFTGLVGITSSSKALSTVYNDHLIAINQLNEIRNHQMQMRIELFAARQEKDAFEMLDHIDKARSSIFQIENLLKSYEERSLLADEKALFDTFVAARLNFGRNGVIPMIDLLQAEKFEQADRLRNEVLTPGYMKASKGIDDLIQYQVEKAKVEYEKTAKIAKTIRIGSIASIIIGLALTIAIGFIITRSIAYGVVELEHMANELSKGDFTARAQHDSNDELSGVARVFNQMADEFSGIIRQVRQSAHQVSESSEMQAKTAERVLSLTHNQTAQAGSAAHSLDNLNSAVREIAEKADKVVAASSEASVMAGKGQSVVNNAVKGIQEVARSVSDSAQLIAALGKRSDQIGQIVGVIKEIADQTNLLALNAAIEAARAGEQGRGFAVVADEVKKLAERTATATSEISVMINAIQSETGNAVSTMERGSTQVNAGVALANEAGKSLLEINSSVKQVVEMIQQIAASTRTQSKATDEITANVEHIAQMAQDNAASIEQSTRASHELEEQSANLERVVSRFKL